jgi:hypothetical protein
MVKGPFSETFVEKITEFQFQEEKSFEITKIFGGFGPIFSFLLLKLPYLTNRF